MSHHLPSGRQGLALSQGADGSHCCDPGDDQNSFFTTRELILQPKEKSTFSSSGSINPCWLGTKGIYTAGSASAKKRRSSSTFPRKSMSTISPDEYRLPPHGQDIPYDWSRKMDERKAKLAARNSKTNSITEAPNSRRMCFVNFGHFNLEFVSDFDIRNSDFRIATESRVRRGRGR